MTSHLGCTMAAGTGCPDSGTKLLRIKCGVGHWVILRVILLGWFFLSGAAVYGQSNRGHEFLEFVRAQAAAIDRPAAALASLDAWHAHRAALSRKLVEAWGGFPEQPCPLDARLLGQLARDGYRIEKVLFQTRPGIWMTANAYVPDGDGPFPAVLCVHGHWRGAKQDPVVQARCVGLTRLGYFVLAVDAFGAGERGIGKRLGEYHGEMTGATLLPVGLPLSGLQVYENRRAVDYLQSRPEVDPQRIGVTGASGGGNQTMYAGATDERLQAIVPVCSVGNFQAYLGAACCMCEVVPGALRFTEEWGLLAMSAPRALMVVSATRDARQFSVAEAQKSLVDAESIYRLHAPAGQLRHAIFESPHDYSQAMRESMYGWMERHLAKRGDGAPVAEPAFTAEDPELLRCFPGDTRPDDFVTIPRFAAAEGKRLVTSRITPRTVEDWRRQSVDMLRTLREDTFGGCPTADERALQVEETRDDTGRTIAFCPEPGLRLTARCEPADADRVAILLDLEGAASAASHPLAAALRRSGWGIVTVDLRATGALAYTSDKIGRAPDHNTAEWSLWLGRPLLGQWVVDVSRTLDALSAADRSPPTAAVVGFGSAGVVAVCAAALDPRIRSVVAVNMLTSYITDVPYEGQRLGILAPGIVRDVGDIPQLVALVAPRPAVLAGGMTGSGGPLAASELPSVYESTAAVWQLLNASEAIQFVDPAEAAEIARSMSP